MTYREALAKAGTEYLKRTIDNSETMAGAARRAGVNRTVLYRLMSRHGIKPNRRNAGNDAWRSLSQ